MNVSEIMQKDVVTISPDESVALASRLLSRHNIGSLPVCTESGTLRGIVTDRDIVLRCVANDCDPAETPVRDIMSRNIISISPGDDISRISELMGSEQVRRLPVTNGEKLVGVVALGDIARRTRLEMEASQALSEISSNLRRK